MRIGLLALGLAVVTLAACGDEPEKKEILPTAPSKPAAVAAIAKPLPQIDMSKASSICRASVKAHQVASLRLIQAPRDPIAQQKASAFNALVSDACK